MTSKDSFGSYSPMIAAEFVEEFEGFRSEAYRCSAGVLTIGIGHVILPGETYTRSPDGVPKVTMSEARAILANDLGKHADKLAPYVNADVGPDQYVAILSLAFNVGVNAVRGSTLLRLLNRGDYLGAADEFTKWVYAGGKKVPGLVRRRTAERDLFLRDENA